MRGLNSLTQNFADFTRPPNAECAFWSVQGMRDLHDVRVDDRCSQTGARTFSCVRKTAMTYAMAIDDDTLAPAPALDQTEFVHELRPLCLQPHAINPQKDMGPTNCARFRRSVTRRSSHPLRVCNGTFSKCGRDRTAHSDCRLSSRRGFKTRVRSFIQPLLNEALGIHELEPAKQGFLIGDPERHLHIEIVRIAFSRHLSSTT